MFFWTTSVTADPISLYIENGNFINWLSPNRIRATIADNGPGSWIFTRKDDGLQYYYEYYTFNGAAYRGRLTAIGP